MSTRPTPDPVGPGQESVWDYPRPPVARPTSARVEVWFAGRAIAETTSAVRVLETSQAPAYYLPLDDVDLTTLATTARRSRCEWKGEATYLDVVVGDRRALVAAWTYLDPAPGFESITRHIAFYPHAVDRCLVDGEEVQANEGDFYGGWITSAVVGPFKGGEGTSRW
jgi:uncharacterized protein (DUF427 family)